MRQVQAGRQSITYRHRLGEYQLRIGFRSIKDAPHLVAPYFKLEFQLDQCCIANSDAVLLVLSLVVIMYDNYNILYLDFAHMVLMYGAS